MIAATNGTSLACIDLISDAGYTLWVYESAERRANSDGKEHVSLNGSPNAADILAALGAGWVASADIPASPPAPKSITARQIRLWLASHGVSMSAVESAIDAIPDAQQREMVRVEWEYAPYVERSHPMLLPLAAALGLSAGQVDAAFIAAARL